jgi:poly-gamma-glutamate capsule biosynthesis protein CapA/YwtB (metallophosphatase superfamily)
VKNIIIGVLIVSAVFIFCPGGSRKIHQNNIEIHVKHADSIVHDSKISPHHIDTIAIIGVGDIMLGTDYPSAKYLPPGGTCKMLLKNVMSFILDADITFGNLEGVFAGNKGKAKHCNNPDQCYVFRMPEQYVNCLVDADFDLISVANNHVNDFGYEGIKNSAKVLNNAGIVYAGLVDIPYTILKKDSITYGFCAFAPNSGTADLLNINSVTSIVKKLDSITDIVIVSFHAGAEGKNNQHVTKKTEYFLGYNRGNIYEFAHKVIDAGADVLFGHGPHVTRAVEIYKDRFISYSLGNFCTYRRFNLSGPNGYAPIMKVYVTKEGKFIKAKAIPIYQEGEGIPKYDSLHRAIKKIQELTLADFPENNLVIDDNGNIYSNNSN